MSLPDHHHQQTADLAALLGLSPQPGVSVYNVTLRPGGPDIGKRPTAVVELVLDADTYARAVQLLNPTLTEPR